MKFVDAGVITFRGRLRTHLSTALSTDVYTTRRPHTLLCRRRRSVRTQPWTIARGGEKLSNLFTIWIRGNDLLTYVFLLQISRRSENKYINNNIVFIYW